jgi:NADPH:quinone reductase-like Zn-dependent oxidoreductase
MMKAIVYTRYGSPNVLHLKEVAMPAPKADEVLIKICAASINAADWYALKGDPFLVRLMNGGILKPKKTILGFDIAGQIEAIGENVTAFKVGDAVYADTSGCGGGGFAEYVCVPEGAIALKPARLTFEEAAAVPMAGITALQGLRDKGKIQAGQTVLINGASGGVGTFAVQLAKAFGAEVTAVCSTRHIEMVRALGADHIIDYTRENFTRNGQRYDLIIAANGYHPLRDYRRALKPKGIYVVTGGKMAQIFQGMLLGSVVSMFGSKKMGNLMATPNPKDLVFLSDWLESGKVAPVIDRCYPLSETAEAMRYVGERRAKGKVVISIAQPHNA